MALMEWFRRGRRRLDVAPIAATPRVERRLSYLPTGDRFDVVGEASYQDALATITGGKLPEGHQKPVVALLLPDDDNPYDPRAVEVVVQERTVAYVPRDRCEQFRGYIDLARAQGHLLAAHAVIVGGWNRGSGDEGHFGIYLDASLTEQYGTGEEEEDPHVLRVAPVRTIHRVPPGRTFEVAGESGRGPSLAEVIGKRDTPYNDDRFLAAIVPNGDTFDVVALCRADALPKASVSGRKIGTVMKRDTPQWSGAAARLCGPGAVLTVEAIASGFGPIDGEEGKRTPLVVTLDALIG